MKRTTSMLYAGIFIGLIITGTMMLSWYLTPPHPDRVGYWIIIFLVGYPLIGMAGLLAFARRNELGLPVWLGASLMSYPVLSFALSALAGLGPLSDALDARLSLLGGLDGLQLLLWVLTCGVVVRSLVGLHRKYAYGRAQHG